jgi:hypothetical protein
VRKPSDLAVPPVTPSPKKGNNRFIKKTFLLDKSKPSSLMVFPVAKMQLSYGRHTLIPVTAKMIHSAVRKDNRFFLMDGHPLHMVNIVGAVQNYNKVT